MDSIPEEKAEKLKNSLEEDYNVRSGWGSARVEYESNLTFPWPYDMGEYHERIERAAEFLKQNFGQLYLIVYESEQYLPEAENFVEEHGSALKIEADNIPECLELNEFMIVPENLEWCVVIDHDGRIGFNGQEKFISEVKEFFDDWRVLSHRKTGSGLQNRKNGKVINPILSIYFSEQGKKYRNSIVSSLIGEAFKEFDLEINYEIRVKVDQDRQDFLGELMCEKVKMIAWEKEDVEFKLAGKIESTKEKSLKDQMTLFLGESIFRHRREKSNSNRRNGNIDYNWEKILALAVGYTQINHREPIFQKKRDKKHLRENKEKIKKKMEEKYNLQDQEILIGTKDLHYWTGFHIAYLLSQEDAAENLIEYNKEQTLEKVEEVLG